MWCGDDDQIEVYGNEHRCATCRENESAISGARGFIRMYGLRPLGGSLDSEDEEEREYRVAARDARAALNTSKLADPPSRDEVRKAMSGAGTSAVERVESLDVDEAPAADGGADARSQHSATRASGSAATPRAGGRSRSPSKKTTKPSQSGSSSQTAKAAKAESSPAKDVDLQTLEARVTTLLDKLSTIDQQINEKSANGGLAAKARIKDLERQRDSVMHTLAALEKARRLQSG